MTDAYVKAESVILRMRPNMSAVDRKLALRSLTRHRDELEKRRVELDAELDAQYDKLTPERSEKYPDIFERKWATFSDAEEEYREISDLIAEIDLRVEGGDLIGWKEESKATHRGLPDHESGSTTPDVPAVQRSLLDVYGRT